ncbi:uncharacterized protein BKA55DRAFT_703859 [Fusarium redolens]|uniref:Uncharacterized protein n=1 Tax=Fusarium redolens TaxID=48865 RepID=A0A9P9GRZ0_FUSRE|nr:uncharacterized protein BKA55DRAFT_703859 [Fusarium redolens]KAH7244071.1 hypothetical protein BKA55DRAFT_703859 [Fusarium redolens]
MARKEKKREEIGTETGKGKKKKKQQRNGLSQSMAGGCVRRREYEVGVSVPSSNPDPASPGQSQRSGVPAFPLIAPVKYLISPLERLRFRSTILESDALDQTQTQTQRGLMESLDGLPFRWPRVLPQTSDKTLHTHTRPAVPRPGCAPCPVVLAGHVWLYLLVLRQTHTKPGTTDMTILWPSWRSPADTAPSDNPGFREVR